MGLSLSEFEALTPAQFIYAWSGWAALQRDHSRHQWEIARWQTWTLTCIQIDRKDRRPITQMFPFPWDEPLKEESQEPPLTLEQRRQRVNDILKCIKQL